MIGAAVLVNVSVREYDALNNQIFNVAKFTILTPLSLLFRIVGLVIFSLHTFALKSPNRIFIWYLGK